MSVRNKDLSKALQGKAKNQTSQEGIIEFRLAGNTVMLPNIRCMMGPLTADSLKPLFLWQQTEENVPCGLVSYVPAKHGRRTERACYKEPHEITKIVRRANETLPAFKERWTVETGLIMGVSEVMKISSFMDSVKSPELAKRFSSNIPQDSGQGRIEILPSAQGNQLGHRTPLPPKRRKRKDREQQGSLVNASITSTEGISDDASDEPLIIEAEVEGYLVRRVYVDEGSSVEVMFEHCFENLHPDGGRLSSDCKNQLKTLLINNLEVFAWEPSDMTGVPRKIIEHSLNVNPSLEPFLPKRRTLFPVESEAVTNVVGFMALCVGTTEDEIKTSLLQEQGSFCYMKMYHLDFKNNAGATLPTIALTQRSKPNRKDLEAYVDDMVIKYSPHRMELGATPKDKGPYLDLTSPKTLTKCRESQCGSKGGGLGSIDDRTKRRQCPGTRYRELEPLNEAEKNYSPLEKLWPLSLGTYKISFIPRNAIKGQVLADFLSDAPDGETEEEYFRMPEVPPENSNWLLSNQWGYEAPKSLMIKYLAKAKEFISEFKTFSIENIPREDNQKADILSKLATVPFSHLTKEILVEVLNERSTDAKDVQTIVEEEGGNNWMTPISSPLPSKLCKSGQLLHWEFLGMHLGPKSGSPGKAMRSRLLLDNKACGCKKSRKMFGLPKDKLSQTMEHIAGKELQGWTQFKQSKWRKRPSVLGIMRSEAVKQDREEKEVGAKYGKAITRVQEHSRMVLKVQTMEDKVCLELAAV
ncbi:hypothetical protein Tco_0385595 [Tanacetum coccineum]